MKNNRFTQFYIPRLNCLNSLVVGSGLKRNWAVKQNFNILYMFHNLKTILFLVFFSRIQNCCSFYFQYFFLEILSRYMIYNRYMLALMFFFGGVAAGGFMKIKH